MTRSRPSRPPNGLDDVVVAGAAAEVPLEPFADRLLARRVPVLDQRDRRHHHPRRAVAALERVVVVERLLHGMQLAVRRETLDRRDLRAVGLDAEHRARLRRGAVDEHRAGAARRRVAADVRARSARAARAARRRATRVARARARASCRSRSARRVAPQASLRRASRYRSVSRAYTAHATAAAASRATPRLPCPSCARSTRTSSTAGSRRCARRSTRRTPPRATSTGSGRREETVWLLATEAGDDVGAGDRDRWLARARGCRARRGASRLGGARSRRRRAAAPGSLGLGARARVTGS